MWCIANTIAAEFRVGAAGKTVLEFRFADKTKQDDGLLKTTARRILSYSDNFAFTRRGSWTH